MSGHITTVRGDIDPAALGFCQPHEHLFIAPGPAADRYPQLLIDDICRTETDAIAFRDAGGSAIVDAQPLFTGRDAEALLRISEDCGIHVVASTGFHKLFYYGEGNPFLDQSEDEMAGVFTGEIDEGMYAAPFYPVNGSTASGITAWTDLFVSGAMRRTEIRAGVIKAALEPDFTDLHSKLFGAVARVSAVTGTAILIHVDEGAGPLRLARFLDARGVRPERTIYCHLDRAAGDISLHKELARGGAYLEYDTVARPKYHTQEDEVRVIMEMLEAGFADRILMSLDVTRMRLRGYGGAPGLEYMKTDFIPFLQSSGADAAHIQKIFVENPARALARIVKPLPHI
ncbi:MAG: hypothetical protein LBO70_06730 [Clostridiales Family XIII bacterium]|jgi:phosphotriesterase-related protein|nr:hypothetical protein [Clostridiales Family XIII bacterium]